MTKKYLSALILSCICMTVTGCGAGTSNAAVSSAESIGKEVISADASGWDGATLSITKSVNKIIPKGTELKFPTTM